MSKKRLMAVVLLSVTIFVGTVAVILNSSSKVEAATTKSIIMSSAANVPVTGLSGVDQIDIAIKESLVLDTAVEPSHATNTKLVYRSSNTRIATVTAKGVVTGIRAGDVVITVGAEDNSSNVAIKEIKVSVLTDKLIMPTSIKLSRNTLNLASAGRNALLTAKISPTNTSIKSVAWTSSDANVATVSSTGRVTAVGGGTATITAAASGDNQVLDTCEVTVGGSVNVPVTGLSGVDQIDIAIREAFVLDTAVEPSHATNTKLVYRSSNTRIATVTAKGVVTGIRAGDVVITVGAEDNSSDVAIKEIKVSVLTDKLIMPTSIKLSRNTLNLALAGRSALLTAQISPTNTSIKSVTWTSSDTNVVKVSDGRVTAVGSGTAIITARASSSGEVIDTCIVTVR